MFPSEGPFRTTGAAALVWVGATGCPTGAGVKVDLVGPAGSLEPPREARGRSGATLPALAPLLLAGAPGGQIAIAGLDRARPSRGELIQGPAAGPFTTLTTGRQTLAPGVLATAYLGDLGILGTTGPGSRLSVDVERHYASRPVQRGLLAGPAAAGARPEALALDYRSDALAVWARDGELYAWDLPASGRPRRPQPLGPTGPDPHVAALISDDNRAIVLWAVDSPGTTRVYLDYSAVGVSFGAPQLLDSFSDPDGLAPPAGSTQLVRLSSESVMAAWSAAVAGHWVLRTAPIDQRGLLSVSTISAPGEDVLLDDLAPGPRGEAMVLWSQAPVSPAGRAEPDRESLQAARGTEGPPGVTHFGAPEPIAAPGVVSGATIAIDPSNDLALAAWLGQDGSIRWSARNPTPAG